VNPNDAKPSSHSHHEIDYAQSAPVVILPSGVSGTSELVADTSTGPFTKREVSPNLTVITRSLPKKIKKRFKCDFCPKKFDSRMTLRIHAFTHKKGGGEPITCEICNKSFKNRSSLGQHMNIHTKLKVYTCGICGKTCNFKSNLRVHMMRHRQSGWFPCNICNNSFNSRNTLDRHKATRHSSGNVAPRFCCDICGRSYTLANNLSRHKKHAHSGGDGE